MMEYLLAAGLVAVIALGAVMFVLKINLLPALVTGIIVVAGINPLVYSIGSEISKDQASTFKEYWNGYETKAYKNDRTCVKNGSCAHTYDCDPYEERERRSRTVTDSKGNSKTEYYYVTVTKYESCPYSTQETSYYVDSTVDTFTIASNVMTGPEYRAYERQIPGGRQGDPALWVEAKNRIESGKPGPVTAVKDYKNYILASQETLFSEYSENIETLKGKNLLPAFSNGVFSHYHANKAYKVGDVNVPLFGDYLTDVAYLNGAVGDDLHGDLHVVFAPENVEGGKDEYLNTLIAYWQSEELGKNALSKNSIVVLIGVKQDGSEVAWAKATTGMPLGNEHLLTQIASDLQGKKMDGNLIGRPSFNPATEEIISGNGELEKILWGDNKFERVSMTANSEDDNGSGFSYLRDELEPNGWALFWISFFNLLLGGALIGGMIALIIGEVLPSHLAHWKGTGVGSSYARNRSAYAGSAYGTRSSYSSPYSNRSYGKVKKKKSNDFWDSM